MVCWSDAIFFDGSELPRLFLNGEDAEAQHLAVTQAFHTGLEHLSLGSQSATAVRSAKKVPSPRKSDKLCLAVPVPTSG